MQRPGRAQDRILASLYFPRRGAAPFYNRRLSYAS
jgi:hypothetical protein